ncbi:MAG TPA: PhzF family phenazine biosynthesis protein [Candidatus Cybelea sp.]|jgi:trans-2,3-dihydro-3-hydroxyanthranilate isomerase|nr:PhzF family phenazine biosynthesis protein [Candidatus Cybelea sp.]
MTWDYSIVDVFTQTPLEGNALAVFHDAAGLDAATMQKIARETNLSETTFIFPPERPESAARVRIFTPSKEMLFAGHPTVGTAWVLRDIGRVPREQTRFVLDENVGPIDIRVDGEGLVWLRTPPIRTLRQYDAEASAAAIGLKQSDLLEGVPAQNRSAGSPLIFIALRDAAAVDRAEVDTTAFRRLLANENEPTGVFAFAPVPAGAYSRMFGNDLGIAEDPATGGATGPLASLMMDYSLVPRAAGTRFVSEQGTKMGRRSLLHVFIDGEGGERGIEVGGHVTPVARARLQLLR